jgi:hypothetical protein
MSSAGSGKPAGNKASAAAAAAPEMGLNRFVRFVALIERLGNALGTLAFTWATVVLLGGYSKDLRLDGDFWFATAIVFLEATRYAKNRFLSALQSDTLRTYINMVFMILSCFCKCA